MWLPERSRVEPDWKSKFKAPLPEIIPDWLALPLTRRSSPPETWMASVPLPDRVFDSLTITPVAEPEVSK